MAQVGGAERAAGHPPTDRPRRWVAPLVLTLLVAGAYGQTVSFDLVWDDHTHFVDFPTMRKGLGWWDILTSPTSAYFDQGPGNDRMYRPLLAAALLADRAVWGLHPAGYHAPASWHTCCVFSSCGA